MDYNSNKCENSRPCAVDVLSGRNRVKLFFWGGGGPYPGADTGFPERGG